MFENFKIGGIIPLTTIDYPHELSAVVFCQGCLWHCPYCHNKHLASQQTKTQYSFDDLHKFLIKRKGLLEAIVFSGGEPTLQDDLPAVIKEVKAMGFKIGLHTTGFDSIRFSKVLNLCDWIGFDVKNILNSKYDLITGVKDSAREVLKSLNLLIQSGQKYELRITQDQKLINESDLWEIQQYLSLRFKADLKVQKAIQR